MGFAEPVTVALGAEYRKETYEIEAGDAASRYKTGAQAYPGFSLTDAAEHDRNNKAGYVDVAVAPIAALHLDFAARYEDFSDFGDTTVGKLTARYDFTPAFALRGTVIIFPAFRLRGHYVTIATLGVGEIVTLTILNWDSLTNGPVGLTGVPPLSAFGVVRNSSRSTKSFGNSCVVESCWMRRPSGGVVTISRPFLATNLPSLLLVLPSRECKWCYTWAYLILMTSY